MWGALFCRFRSATTFLHRKHGTLKLLHGRVFAGYSSAFSTSAAFAS